MGMRSLKISEISLRLFNIFLIVGTLFLTRPGMVAVANAQGTGGVDELIGATELALSRAQYGIGPHTTSLKGSDGNWAVTVVLRDEDPVGEPFFVLLERIDNQWKAILPEQASEYNEGLSRVPDTLVDPITKEYLHQPEPIEASPSNNVLADSAYTGFYLPWEYGQKARVAVPPTTQGHVNQIDFSLWVEDDERLDGNIAATKDGTVIYTKDSSNVDCDWNSQVQNWVYKGTTDICPWTESNLIVLQHADGTYSWYLHPAQDSIPENFKQPNALVYRGDIIAVEGSTGWAEGVHLHFMVTTDYFMGLSGMPWGYNRVQVEFTNGTQALTYADMYYHAIYESLSSPVGGNHLPNIPNPLNPINSSTQYETPEICWEDTGDPDGDPVTFNVSLSGATSQVSGWISSTCWAPLDPPLGAYTWNVRAKDDSEAESSPSPDESFSIVSSTAPWTVQYFSGDLHWSDGNDVSNQICSETLEEPTLDMNYGDGPPCVGEVSDDWVGDYRATVDFLPGNYVFIVEHDDGLKFYLDGGSIAEREDASLSQALCPALSLSGEHELWAILREDVEQAKIKLSWSVDTTLCDPPGSFEKSNPANGATGQPINLTLNWTNSGGASTFEYCVYTDDSTDCDGDWMDAGNNTSASVNGLEYGVTYHWQVRALNDNGTTEADSDVWWTFMTVPKTPTLITPSGTIDTSMLPFEWDVSTGATAYRLAVYSYPTADYVILGQVSLSYCDASRCSYPSPISLLNGTYKFKVLAYYAGGVTPYSDWKWFTVDAAVLPFGPLSPSGTIDGVSKPDFEWSVYPGATAYRLAMYSNAASAYLILDTVSTSYCDSTQCTYPSPISLSNGDYRFKVLAYIPGGATPYTDWMDFTVTGVALPPPAYPPTPLSPSGTVTTHRPAFEWSAVENAAFYRLGVYSYVTGTYVILQNLYVSCVGGVCSYTPTIDLENGSYKFKVLARNSSGYTAYSSWLRFVVSSELPVAPTLLAPSGIVGENPPAFQWSAVDGATSYRLAVYSYATKSYTILTTVYPGACGGGVCTYTPLSALASGDYKFKMLTYNAYGASAYSQFMSFTIP